ncbi:MAG: hypothetical protein KF764_20685 [Labilithrix sp.]|nr:hypothetical protein [Labilithrix sp.]MBX3225030.1 hypothetical protein [Labilithrix sp.]
MSVRPLSPVRSAAAWAVLTTGALGGLLFACDEVYADPVTAPFTSPFGGAPDSGLTTTRTPPVACSYAPQENSPCYQRNSVCEYGSSPDSRCNTLFVCANDSQYGTYWTEQAPPSCVAECPAASDIVDGAPCDLGDAGTGPEAELHCSTSVGTCVCTTGRDGANAHARKWVCTVPADGCPANRPLLGQPCSGTRSCDYGSCTSKRGMRMLCEDDVWQTEIAECE